MSVFPYGDMMDRLLFALRDRLPEEPENGPRCLACLEDAYAVILGYTGLETLPERLMNAVVRFAVVLYDRTGNEGETSRREGDISRSFSDMPEDIRMQVRPYRKAVTRI